MNFKHTYKTILTVLIGFALLTSCNNKTKCKPEKELDVMDTLTKDSSVIAVEGDIIGDTITIYDDVAKIMAGIPVDSISPYYEITQTKSWLAHQKKLDMLWKRSIDNQTNARTWAAANLDSITDKYEQLLYPFSGADWVYANTFFRYPEEIVMLALEPSGSIPNFKNASDEELEYMEQQLQNSVADIFGFSFFITKNMSKSMKHVEIEGTLPVMMIMLARSGKHIRSVKTGKLMADGGLDTSSKVKANMAEIKFGPADSIQTITYLSCDLANYKFTHDTTLVNYLDSHVRNRCASYMKAASYLMHSKNFTEIKKFVMQRSSLVLQDDSGIKYEDLKNAGFDCKLFGEYTRPINMFKEKYQPTLEAAYKEQGQKKLPFRIGYGVKYNMIAATR